MDIIPDIIGNRRARDALKEREGPAFDSEEAIKKREAAAEERRRQSRAMAGESIKRGLEESEFVTHAMHL